MDLMTSFVSCLLPLMLASRLRNKTSSTTYDPLAELKIHKSINYIFEKALDFERLLIRHGVTLPVGGSLLLVARKT